LFTDGQMISVVTPTFTFYLVTKHALLETFQSTSTAEKIIIEISFSLIIYMIFCNCKFLQ
jgi:hypothetical protein